MLYVQCNKDWFICSELGKHLIGIKKVIKVSHGEMIGILEWQFGRHLVLKKIQTFLFLNTTILLFLKAHWEYMINIDVGILETMTKWWLDNKLSIL